jgi:hypothetical protein
MIFVKVKTRIFLFLMGWDWVHLVLRPLFDLLYQPQIIDDDDECGAVCGMRIGRGNQSTWRKPSTVPLRPPQIPHDLSRSRTRSVETCSETSLLNKRVLIRQYQFVSVCGYCCCVDAPINVIILETRGYVWSKVKKECPMFLKYTLCRNKADTI